MGYYPRAISGTQGAGQRKMNLAGLLQLGERDPPLIPGGMIPAGVFVIGIFTSIGAVAVGAVGAAAHERYVRGGSAAGAAAKVRQLANGLVERLGFMTAAVCFGMLVATFFAAIGGGFLAFFAGVALVVLAAAFGRALLAHRNGDGGGGGAASGGATFTHEERGATPLAANDYAAQPPMASPLTSPADAHGTFAAAPTVSPLTSSVPPLTMASATIDVPTANAQGTANVRLSDMDD